MRHLHDHIADAENRVVHEQKTAIVERMVAEFKVDASVVNLAEDVPNTLDTLRALCKRLFLSL